MKKQFSLLVLFFFTCSISQAENKIKRISRVVYDHRDGIALLLDVLVPEKQNGIAVFKIISEEWVSYNADEYPQNDFKAFTDHGETVFLVSHGSRPKYKVPEIIDQIQHAIQFVRYNAKKFGVDPSRFAIMGAGSGGHLSLAAAVFGKDKLSAETYRHMHGLKVTDNVDPVNLVSSKVQAVACFYPPANLAGGPESISATFKKETVYANGFDIPPNSSPEQVKEILKSSSPYFFISDTTTPPVLIFHGTNDSLVPYAQTMDLADKLRKNKVPYRLITRKNAGHGWPHKTGDDQVIIRWFEKYL